MPEQLINVFPIKKTDKTSLGSRIDCILDRTVTNLSGSSIRTVDDTASLQKTGVNRRFVDLSNENVATVIRDEICIDRREHSLMNGSIDRGS